MTAYPQSITPGMFKQMVVRLEYTLTNPKAGVHFVGCEPGDTVHPDLFNFELIVIAISSLLYYK